jgi:hypothetical protein
VLTRAGVRERIGDNDEVWARLDGLRKAGIPLSAEEASTLAAVEKQITDLLPADAKAILEASRRYAETGEITPLMQELRGRPDYSSLLTNVEAVDMTNPDTLAQLQAQGARFASLDDTVLNVLENHVPVTSIPIVPENNARLDPRQDSLAYMLDEYHTGLKDGNPNAYEDALKGTVKGLLTDPFEGKPASLDIATTYVMERDIASAQPGDIAPGLAERLLDNPSAKSEFENDLKDLAQRYMDGNNKVKILFKDAFDKTVVAQIEKDKANGKVENIVKDLTGNLDALVTQQAFNILQNAKQPLDNFVSDAQTENRLGVTMDSLVTGATTTQLFQTSKGEVTITSDLTSKSNYDEDITRHVVRRHILGDTQYRYLFDSAYAKTNTYKGNPIPEGSATVFKGFEPLADAYQAAIAEDKANGVTNPGLSFLQKTMADPSVRREALSRVLRTIERGKMTPTNEEGVYSVVATVAGESVQVKLREVQPQKYVLVAGY